MAQSAVIIGASGGIGSALVEALRDEASFDRVWTFARSFAGPDHIDLTEEATIAAAAASVAAGPPPKLVIVATGVLQDEGTSPEKALADLAPERLLHSYAVNAVGPALVMKHFLPLLPKVGEPVLAVLSARVGSISDNNLGGWHGYRASKAALNMLVRGAAIEARRRHPRTIVVGLHPGTVDTALSRPFQGNVAPGSLFKPDRSAVQLLDVIDGLKPQDSGRCFGWDGEEIAP